MIVEADCAPLGIKLMPGHFQFPYGIHRTKSVTVERALGGGIGGRHGNSDEGEDKDAHNDGKFCDNGK